jgi:hypothetical protein
LIFFLKFFANLVDVPGGLFLYRGLMSNRGAIALILIIIFLASYPQAHGQVQTPSSSSGCCKIHTASGLTARIGGRLVCNYDIVGVKTVSCLTSTASACQLPSPGYISRLGSREGEPCTFTNYIFHQNSCEQETSPRCGTTAILGSIIQAQ